MDSKEIIKKYSFQKDLNRLPVGTGGEGYSNPGLIRKSLLATRPNQSN